MTLAMPLAVLFPFSICPSSVASILLPYTDGAKTWSVRFVVELGEDLSRTCEFGPFVAGFGV
jgi:hypothetical protein